MVCWFLRSCVRLAYHTGLSFLFYLFIFKGQRNLKRLIALIGFLPVPLQLSQWCRISEGYWCVCLGWWDWGQRADGWVREMPPQSVLPWARCDCSNKLGWGKRPGKMIELDIQHQKVLLKGQSCLQYLPDHYGHECEGLDVDCKSMYEEGPIFLSYAILDVCKLARLVKGWYFHGKSVYICNLADSKMNQVFSLVLPLGDVLICKAPQTHQAKQERVHQDNNRYLTALLYCLCTVNVGDAVRACDEFCVSVANYLAQ